MTKMSSAYICTHYERQKQEISRKVQCFNSTTRKYFRELLVYIFPHEFSHRYRPFSDQSYHGYRVESTPPSSFKT